MVTKIPMQNPNNSGLEISAFQDDLDKMWHKEGVRATKGVPPRSSTVRSQSDPQK